ncbi:alpha-1,2-fucosyltransferase [Bacteroides sedimenti]|uniref:Alpha-1,2-fucosyltransferase n=1 Tax=Bacteroides sedimenti TaxID=2136147 RepID=A0ABM8I6W6_9BACE
MKKMKLIFSGGLGNQMFQYAFYLSLKEKGLNVDIDLSLYSFIDMHNGYELPSIFCIPNGTNDKSLNIKLRIIYLRILLKFKPKKIIYIDPFYFTNIPFNKNNYKFLFGYWQSEKYFENIREIILRKFIFRSIDSQNIKLSDQIKSENSVSLHIRRGDYLNNSLYSDICTDEYYCSAINFMLNKLDNPVFYVFSNDIKWTKNYLKRFSIKHKIVTLNHGKKSYQDMFLMTNCKHNIIANSSFSWWGAWLNDNKDKIVVAPKKWMNTEFEKYKNIVPDSWIKL